MGGGGSSGSAGSSLASIRLTEGELPLIRTTAGMPENFVGRLTGLKIFLSGNFIYIFP